MLFRSFGAAFFVALLALVELALVLLAAVVFFAVVFFAAVLLPVAEEEAVLGLPAGGANATRGVVTKARVAAPTALTGRRSVARDVSNIGARRATRCASSESMLGNE